MTREALEEGRREVMELRKSIAAAEAAFGVASGDADGAKAAAAAAKVELAGESGSIPGQILVEIIRFHHLTKGSPRKWQV